MTFLVAAGITVMAAAIMMGVWISNDVEDVGLGILDDAPYDDVDAGYVDRSLTS